MMTRIFTAALGLCYSTLCGAEAFSPKEPLQNPANSGPFQPTWDSLKNYKQAPEWFRDAKFGIWAHWDAQSVPEAENGWYGRGMYEYKVQETGKTSPTYTYHLAHYGHPSKFGFKDIDNLWRAENWDPGKLIALYKKAGAQYFVALANHHDNLDCWDSKYQPWNSVRVGPKKDIVGGWARVARAAGLRFGVSVHASHAWSWFEPAQGADTEGSFAGVPYDGKLTKADGKGQWWEGLDPQDLYAQNHKSGKCLEWFWNAEKGSSIPDKAYCEKFFNRTIDLIDKYHPDLLYFDDAVLPLWPVSDVGLKIAANYYNSNMQWHRGNNEAVLNGKCLNEEQQQCMVRDIERGKSARIEPSVWQTDTCIGWWFYDRSLFKSHGYKKASDIIPMLADIVSKNGNLFLNIPMRGDGTIDEDEITFLQEMAKWMEVNREGIIATRPWKVFGEGPSTTADNGKGYAEGQADVSKNPFTAKDIRFTTSKDGKTLYAIALGWPSDGKLVVKSLAKNAPNFPGEIRAVKLLGSSEKLVFARDETGLIVTVPNRKPCEYAYVMKIAGQ
jgi:alpha-L-fucosidase